MTKTKRAAPTPVNGSTPAEAAPESLDKVRDILFGGQIRAVESRLNAAETRLLQGQENVRADLSKQIAQLESTLQKEVQSLGERLAGLLRQAHHQPVLVQRARLRYRGGALSGFSAGIAAAACGGARERRRGAPATVGLCE